MITLSQEVVLMLSKDFRSEIWTNVDERVLKAIADANQNTVDGCVGKFACKRNGSKSIQRRNLCHIYYKRNGCKIFLQNMIYIIGMKIKKL